MTQVASIVMPEGVPVDITIQRTEAGPANLRPWDPHYYFACTCGQCGTPQYDINDAVQQGVEHITYHATEDYHG